MKYFPLSADELIERLDAGDRSPEVLAQTAPGMIDHVDRQLAAGWRVSYGDHRYPGGTVLEYSNGYRELVELGGGLQPHRHIREIPPKRRDHHPDPMPTPVPPYNSVKARKMAKADKALATSSQFSTPSFPKYSPFGWLLSDTSRSI